jgi:hypothetical protein
MLMVLSSIADGSETIWSDGKANIQLIGPKLSGATEDIVPACPLYVAVLQLALWARFGTGIMSPGIAAISGDIAIALASLPSPKSI